MIKIIRLILLITLLLLIASCLYIPTPDHGGELMISDEVINLFIPGTTTRGDVLLRLGMPAQRVENDRYFIYHWEAIVGYFVVGSGLSGASAANPNLHYLCFEFTPDNILKRYKHFEQGTLGALGKHPEKYILEWIQENSARTN